MLSEEHRRGGTDAEPVFSCLPAFLINLSSVLEPEFGGGDVLLVQLPFGHRFGSDPGLQRPSVEQHNQSRVDGVLRPTVFRTAELLADLGPLLSTTDVIEDCLTDRVILRVAFVTDRDEGIAVALPGPFDDLVPVGGVGLME